MSSAQQLLQDHQDAIEQCKDVKWHNDLVGKAEAQDDVRRVEKELKKAVDKLQENARVGLSFALHIGLSSLIIIQS